MALQLQVERLHARYAHALDADRLEEWPNFFTENGRYRIATAENEERGLPLPVLYAEGRAMMRDRVQSLRHANIYEPQRYRHMISCGPRRDNCRRGRSALDRQLPRHAHHAGRRHHGLRQRPLPRPHRPVPEPLYEERVVVCDSRRFDTLLAIPL